MDRRDRDSVSVAPLPRRTRSALGHQLQPSHPAEERDRLLVTGSARVQSHAGVAGRGPNGAQHRLRRPGSADQAVRCREDGPRARWPVVQPDRGRGRRRQVRRHARPDVGCYRQPRLRAGRGGRAAGQPDTVQPVLSGKARVLPRELWHVLRRRHAAEQSREHRADAGRGPPVVLQSPYRANGGGAPCAHSGGCAYERHRGGVRRAGSFGRHEPSGERRISD